VPDPANAGVYDELYRIYGDLYPATREHLHRLAAMQELAPGEATPSVLA
jgi:xylulokinase